MLSADFPSRSSFVVVGIGYLVVRALTFTVYIKGALIREDLASSLLIYCFL